MIRLNSQNLKKYAKIVNNDEKYGKEAKLIKKVLLKYPLNKDILAVAIKIAIIDITNNTNISKHKKFVSLYDLAKHICSINNFDKRLQKGDVTLVNQIANVKGKRNFFSFATKYCCYHNYYIYKKDDYSIFDGVVIKNLPKYNEKIKSSWLKKCKENYDYNSFNEAINKTLDMNNIRIKNKKRYFDWFLWYPNKNK